MNKKKWILAPKLTTDFQNKFPEQNPAVLQLLFNRGLSNQERIDEFLNPDYGQDIHDPFLFKEMKKAVARIKKAVQKKEKIVIHGDYDADGVCASAILVSLFKELKRKVFIYIPSRQEEGYGLSKKTIEELASQKFNLIITVDCGISNKQEVALAQEKGMDVIVTDHHFEPPQLPAAYALINPQLKAEKYPFQNLAGAGVAFKLAQALVQSPDKEFTALDKAFEKWLLDLVAIGTVADCSPLLGENRTLVRHGLLVLEKTRRLGLRELAKKASLDLKNIEARKIAFQIAPRLNAAGRLDHANTAFQLLITQSQEEAGKIAEALNKTNQKRQKITEEILEASKKQVGEVSQEDKIIFSQGDWPAGVIGLVAGKLTDCFFRPSLVFGRQGKEIVGSGRSIPEFNIIETVTAAREFLSRYGGHDQACGFTLKNKEALTEFKNKIKEIAEKKIKVEDLVPHLEIDLEVSLKDITWDLYHQLELFQPFGEANPKPKFLVRNLKVLNPEKVGRENNHLRLFATDKKSRINKKLIGFGLGEWADQLKFNDKIDVVFELESNEWNGTKELALKIIDLRKSG